MNKEGAEMLKVERYFSGSVADNIFEDDLTLRNYLALYCCIYGVNKNGELVFPTRGKMLIEFNVDRDRKKRKKASKVKLINVKTGEEKIFDSIDSAACFLRLQSQAVYQTIKKKTKTRSGWKAEYIEEE
ncbi:putative regulatory protein [Clostridium phage phiCDHM19]|nr:putative regulatory protein [Clostridium phage phiCDHM19]CDW17251.1 putative regulatory protein [Clostridium phage phiCDHM19]